MLVISVSESTPPIVRGRYIANPLIQICKFLTSNHQLNQQQDKQNTTEFVILVFPSSAGSQNNFDTFMYINFSSKCQAS